jgi:hypothetical protein
MMSWSNALILEFVSIYEGYPIIWDPKHVGHKNRNEVVDAWEEIHKKMSTPVSVTDLKKKGMLSWRRIAASSIKFWPQKSREQERMRYTDLRGLLLLSWTDF